MMLTLDSRVVAAPSCLGAGVSGETVILSLDDGMYYGLDAVGTLVWGLLQEPRPVRVLRDAILEAYDVAPDRCEADLVALLADMAEHGLVVVSDTPASTS